MAKTEVPYKRIIEYWNTTFEGTPVPAIRSFGRERGAKMKLRWMEWCKEGDPWAILKKVCEFMRRDRWHLGRNESGWTANITYLIRNDSRWRELLERAEVKERQLEAIKLRHHREVEQDIQKRQRTDAQIARLAEQARKRPPLKLPAAFRKKKE